MTSFPISRDAAPPASALAIGAHPDDVEFGAGATLAKWAAAGTIVDILILTDGSKGTWDAGDDVTRLIVRRRDEARAAADRLGVRTVHHLGRVDGELEHSAGERADACRLLREIRPAVVLGHDPWKRYRLHPDHRHAGWLTIDTIVAARDPHFFPGLGRAPHRPDELWLFEADEPNHLESVDRWLDAKHGALLAHESQWRSTMGIEAGTPAEPDQRRDFTDRLAAEATAAGTLDGGSPAEAFRRITEL